MVYIFMIFSKKHSIFACIIPLSSIVSDMHLYLGFTTQFEDRKMSSLIFYTDETQALIVTDTLAVTDQGSRYLSSQRQDISLT